MLYLSERFTAVGMPKFRAKQVFEWIFQKRASSFEQMTNLSKLDRQLLAVSDEMSKLNPDRSAVASAASAAAPLAQRIAERLATMQHDQAIALRLLQRIPDDAENIALADERAAEQAAMALDSLYIAYSKDAKPATPAGRHVGRPGLHS